MTPEEIKALPAGRELDALITKEVIGDEPTVKWIWTNNGGKSYFDIFDTKRDAEDILKHSSIRHRDDGTVVMPLKIYASYSTDIAAAWQVVEKLHIFEFCNITEHTDAPRRDDWVIEMFCKNGNTQYVTGETAPLAICRAALLAVMP